MEQPDSRFQVVLDALGAPQTITVDGDVLDPSVPSQGLCDFFTWSSHQDPEVVGEKYARVFPGSYFSSPEALVEYCTVNGVILAAYEDGPKQTYAVQHSCCAFLRIPSVKAFDDSQNITPTFEGIGVDEERGVWVAESLFGEIAESFSDDASNLRRLFALPMNRVFVYLDISDFSRLKPGEQCLVITSLIQTTRDTDWFPEAILNAIEAQLCIGDGYIYVFPNVADAVKCSAVLADLIEFKVAKGLFPVDFHFRMGVHVGDVYCFWCPGRRGWNYVGSGINDASRVLSAIGSDVDDIVFLSAVTRQSLRSSDNRAWLAVDPHLQNKGRRSDKHGKMHRVYELNHTAAANSLFPSYALRRDRLGSE